MIFNADNIDIHWFSSEVDESVWVILFYDRQLYYDIIFLFYLYSFMSNLSNFIRHQSGQTLKLHKNHLYKIYN